MGQLYVLFPGLVQVIIRDYLAADALKPHYGVGTPTVVAVRKTPFSILTKLTICPETKASGKWERDKVVFAGKLLGTRLQSGWLVRFVCGS